MKAAFISLTMLLLSASVPESKVLICISTGATKYHSHKCQGLSRCTHEIKTVTITEAKDRGYTACGYCY